MYLQTVLPAKKIPEGIHKHTNLVNTSFFTHSKLRLLISIYLVNPLNINIQKGEMIEK